MSIRSTTAELPARALGIARSLDLEDAVAVTFDDGPHPQGTPAVLDALDRAGATASFFMVGEQIQRDRGLAREVIDRGHSVGLHCDRHRSLLLLTPRRLREDLDRAANELASIGVDPIEWYRPPYGVMPLRAVTETRARGWETLLWTKAGRDWRAAASAESIARNATEDLSAGDVILLHDADDYGTSGSWQRTAASLPAIFEAIAARGLRMVGVDGAQAAAIG